MKPIRIAIIGYGKIAEDQHVPSIEANGRFELAATSSRSGHGLGEKFTDWRELIRSVDGLERERPGVAGLPGRVGHPKTLRNHRVAGDAHCRTPAPYTSSRRSRVAWRRSMITCAMRLMSW